jgi:hypothetical protein
MEYDMVVTPTIENGKYVLRLGKYELDEIIYALERLRKQRECSRKSNLKKNGKTEEDHDPTKGRKQSPQVVISQPSLS